MKKLFTIALIFGSLIANAQDFDSTFASIGYTAGATWPQANCFLQQPDGKLIVGVNEHLAVTLCRYNEDGTIDTTFGPYGRAMLNLGICVVHSGTDNVVTDLAIQPDGKILGVGYGTYCYGALCGNTNMEIFRFNSNGTADSTFGDCGIMQSDRVVGGYPATLTYSHLSHIKLLPGGKFIVSGFGQAGGATVYPLLIRFNSDGTLDHTFGTGGITTLNGVYQNVWDNNPRDISIDDMGNITAIGTNIRPIAGFHTYVQVVRVDSSGARDYAFGDSGVVNLTYGSSNGATNIKTRADGKYVILGKEDAMASLTILNPDGSIDSTIFPAGYDSLAIPGYGSNNATSLIVQPDNKMVISGHGMNGYSACAYMGRWNEDGTPDPAFNGYGLDSFNFGVYTHWQSGTFLNDMKVVCGNKIIAVGGITQSTSSPDQGMFIIRYNMEDSVACTYVMPPPLSASIVQQTNNVLVYPNPAEYDLTIENAVPNSRFVMLNALGQQVVSGSITYAKETVSLHRLPTGSYILQLTDPNGNRASVVVSKQ